MYEAELTFAKDLAYKAGSIMQEYSSPDLAVESKSDSSPVTAADQAINDLVISEVAKHFPEHGVIGEEASNHNNEEYVWVCDPIDGTISFINHIPTSVFTLALVKDGQPIVCVTLNPWTNELYTASKGGGAYCNDQKISVSGRSLDGATIAVSGSINTENVQHIAALTESLKGKAHVVSLVSSIFKGCLIAGGYIEGYIFRYSGAHDVASTKLLVEEAGGKVTDLSGNEQRYDRPINGAVISNGAIHEELLKLV